MLTTLGLIGLFMGLISSALLTLAKTGITPASITAYYLGAEVRTDLDSLLVNSTPRPFAELAEVTHIHLVGGSLLLFLLCHLLTVCDVSDRLRTWTFVTAFASFVLTSGSPWLIVYVSPSFSWVFSLSILAFIMSLLLLMAVPLWEMWVRRS